MTLVHAGLAVRCPAVGIGGVRLFPQSGCADGKCWGMRGLPVVLKYFVTAERFFIFFTMF